MERWEQRRISFHKALTRLAEIVNESKKRKLNEYECDGLIQRFEFVHESCWKLMKSYEEYKRYYRHWRGSRDATRYANQLGILSDGDTWMDMIKSRNETSHNYDGTVANGIIDKIVNVYFLEMIKFDRLMDSLSAYSSGNLFDNSDKDVRSE